MIERYSKSGKTKIIEPVSLPVEPPAPEPAPAPSIEEQLQDIKLTVDLLLLKQEGIL